MERAHDIEPLSVVGGELGSRGTPPVALRKLRHEHLDTFRIRPTEQGLMLTKDGVPAPVNTNPRLRQAVHILHDLGALVRRQDRPLRLTSSGALSSERAVDSELSLLEALRDGGYEASVITTFNAYLPFYEEVVLRHLLAGAVATTWS